MAFIVFSYAYTVIVTLLRHIDRSLDVNRTSNKKMYAKPTLGDLHYSITQPFMFATSFMKLNSVIYFVQIISHRSNNQKKKTHI